jgi:unsaturated rhamnogalacturonyl hydrolase
MGWVPVALLGEMDHMRGRNYETLAGITRGLLLSLLPYQDEATGLWHQVVDKGGQSGNWPETSCTCLYAAGICKAARTGVLPPQAFEAAKKAARGVIGRLAYDGDDVLIPDICEGTWVGDYAFYCARQRRVNDLHGVGAFLLMCAEAERASSAM